MVATDGWQKKSIMQMKKLDSFVKESLRYHANARILTTETNLILVGTKRKALKPYTFRNGVTIPQGETVASPMISIHMDNSIYENAKEFRGFRFSGLREREGEIAKHQSVNTSTEFLVFGHGEHAWYYDVQSLLIVVLEDFLP